MNLTSNELPFFYQVACFLLAFLVLEALAKRRKVWSVPALIIYATTAMWYLTEIILYPENSLEFSTEIKDDAFLQVILFLSSFRLFVPLVANKFLPKQSVSRDVFAGALLDARKLLHRLALIWLLLLLWGVSRIKWDFAQALFPLGGRSGTGAMLWSRAAGAQAGSMGFIISSAGYIYLLVCSFFGILLVLQTRPSARLFNILLLAISWPAFLLSGARNSFLAVSMPAFFTYAIVSRQKWWIKLFISAVLFYCLNYAFTIVITYRNVGFSEYLNQVNQGVVEKPKSKHDGLNMAQELFYINQFGRQGVLELQYGKDYVAEALNFVPRAIWPEKPLLGHSYEILRGFGSRTSETGVFATIAAGMIGRGILNFGLWLGPLFPAFLMACWCNILGRLWCQRYSVLRLCLFLVGLGITPNLGRDITFLVLWPFVFGYLLVRYLEYINQKKLGQISTPYHPEA